jgi:N-acetylglucosamine-6-phosphate deacetylase
MRKSFGAARLFDGHRLHRNAVLEVEDGRIVAINLGLGTAQPEGLIAPGFVDLQVNGGGGRMVDGSVGVEGLAHICAAHARLGATAILPTLISDTPEATDAVIAAGIEAARRGIEGFLGLHLEGPHLDPRRKGAHDPGLIRPMTEVDLHRLCNAADKLPALMVTVAPEAVTADQIEKLSAAGAIVSLGHSDCSSEDAGKAIAAGARCVTHLFNAMSQLGNREPGLVGAVLAGDVSAGLIADGIHVAPEVLKIALKVRPTGVFLVSDAMAVAGTALVEFTLGGRRILRRGGRLTLADGTLAGADLTLPQAVSVLIGSVGVDPARALSMATSLPASLVGAGGHGGSLAVGMAANFVLLSEEWELDQVWLRGDPLL